MRSSPFLSPSLVDCSILGCVSTLGKFAPYLLAEKGVEAYFQNRQKGLSNRGFRVLHSRSKGVPFHG